MTEFTQQLRIPAKKNVTQTGQEIDSCSLTGRIFIGLTPCGFISLTVHGM